MSVPAVAIKMPCLLRNSIPIPTRIRDITQYLVSLEATADRTSGLGPTSVRLQVCMKLREPLSSLAGRAGYEALFSRAVALAKANIPALAQATVDADACSISLADANALRPQEADKVAIAVTGHMLDLLCTFLGEALVLRLLHDKWPNVSYSDIKPREETTA